jgi:hypothetical protein
MLTTSVIGYAWLLELKLRYFLTVATSHIVQARLSEFFLSLQLVIWPPQIHAEALFTLATSIII